MSQELMDDITQYIEHRFPVGEPTVNAFSVTGELYIVLSCGGIKPQGEPVRVLTTDIEKAKELFLAEFDKYAEGKDGAVYWRRKPEPYERSHWCDFEQRFVRYYGITARFVITDKPALSEAELNAIKGRDYVLCSI